MKTEIATAIISFVGVILSITFSIISVRRSLKIEQSKIDKDIELLYIQEINKRRLQIYPKIYQEISIFLKVIVLNEINENSLLSHFNNLYSLNTQYSLFFSYETGNFFSELLKLYFKKDKEQEFIPTKENMDYLVIGLSNLKISLKKEIGVYLIEFRDPQRKLDFISYDELDLIKKKKK